MPTRSRFSVGSRIVRGTSVVVPTLVGLFSVIVAVLPYGALGAVPLAPLFPLAAIFFFVLTRPGQMTPISVFVIGLFQDLLTGTPAGLWALVYLAAYGATAALRVLFVGRSAGAAWPGFLVVAGVVGVTIWLLASIVYGQFVPKFPIAGQLMVTAAFYPVLAWVFTLFLPQAEG
jgi:rod shape-determining protein MreD